MTNHLYIHIPFCNQACYYCNFHFSTSLKSKAALVNALCLEIKLQNEFFIDKKEKQKGLPVAQAGKTNLSTIYLGGGTPSLLTYSELMEIFDAVKSSFDVARDAEITLEANPEDLTPEKIAELKETGINRLSIGIQSFIDRDLQWMNRSHSAEQAASCIKNAQDKGISNISIDLIYGIPGLDEKGWQQNLEKATSLGIQHISAYCLTVEPHTALHHFVKTGKVTPADEQLAINHFRILMQHLSEQGFIHYEISNFGKPEYFSRHNTAYWLNRKYLGIGPSAHSYGGNTRQWNISNNSAYIRSLKNNYIPIEKEFLSENDRYNEYVMTSLRTVWGCDLEHIRSNFDNRFSVHCICNVQPYINSGKVIKSGSKLFLTNEGKLLADRIVSDLFFTKGL